MICINSWSIHPQHVSYQSYTCLVADMNIIHLSHAIGRGLKNSYHQNHELIQDLSTSRSIQCIIGHDELCLGRAGNTGWCVCIINFLERMHRSCLVKAGNHNHWEDKCKLSTVSIKCILTRLLSNSKFVWEKDKVALYDTIFLLPPSNSEQVTFLNWGRVFIHLFITSYNEATGRL